MFSISFIVFFDYLLGKHPNSDLDTKVRKAFFFCKRETPTVFFIV